MKFIIYGTHSNDWNNTLSSESQLWDNLNIKSLIIRIFTSVELDTYVNQPHEDKLIFIPLMEQHFYKIYSYGNNNFELNLPSYEIFSCFHSKKKFEIFTKENNLDEHVPTFYDPNLPNLINFPVITKKACSNCGYGSRIYHSIDEYVPNDIVQQYITNCRECVSHLVVNKGRIITEISFEYLFDKEFYIKGQDNSYSTIKYEPDEWVINILSKFLLNYHGVCNVDYKVSETNVYVMEINPRLGGSLMNNLNSLTQILDSWLSIIEY